MALPKISHTQISNQFIDDWISQLNGAAVKTFLAVSRKTIGWHKETDAISLSQLQQITGLSRQGVMNAVDELEKIGLITIDKREYRSTLFTINYEEVVNSVDGGGKLSRPEVVNSVDTQKKPERNSSKETSSPIDRDFEEAWKHYPRKESKKSALKAYRARRKKERADTLLTATKNYAKSVEGRERRFIKLGATFFGPDEHYVDFIESPTPDTSPRKEYRGYCKHCEIEFSHEEPACPECGDTGYAMREVAV